MESSLRKALIYGAVISSTFTGISCRERNKAQARIAAYEENGVVWGWGDIRLASPSATTGIFLDRLPVPGPGGQTMKLVGADSATANAIDVFYADWHPVLDPAIPVVFASQFYLQDRAGGRAGLLDVFVKLKKPGRSWPEAYTLSVGTADIRDPSGSRYPVRLADGVKMSRVAAGDHRGAVVFHYADLPRDLSDDAGAPPSRRLIVEGFNETMRDGQRVWALPAGSQGKLTFISRSIQAKPADHPRLCQDQFFAGARTASNQVNKACKLTLAPSDSNSNWLTCSLLVQFENPENPSNPVGPMTASEKTCRVIGSFLDENDPADQMAAVIVHVGSTSGASE
jgi:hypothetical protein